MIKTIIIEEDDVEIVRYGNNAAFEAGGITVIIQREAAEKLVGQLEAYLAEEPLPTVFDLEAEIAKVEKHRDGYMAKNHEARSENKRLRDTLIRIRKLAEADANEGQGRNASTIHDLAEDTLAYKHSQEEFGDE